MKQPPSYSHLLTNREGLDEDTSYDRCIEHLRRVEYPMLDGLTYLDHAGTTLPSRTLMMTFSQHMQTTLLGNPHSSSSSAPNAAHQIIETTRRKVLHMFGASPDHFDVVFVANATSGIKLVVEAFSGFEEGFDYYYHRDSHTSLVGVRELAERSRCLATDEEVEHWISNREYSDNEHPKRPTLFAYPAQSNMNGRRLPLSWPTLLRCTQGKAQIYTLLDIAALVSTSPIDLSNHTTAPDFLVLSFYKIFGFPDLGALIVRKSAGHVFEKRKYFGGGTTDMITCTTSPWVARKSALRDRLEDGTGATHSILALSCAIDAHNLLFGGLKQVSQHTSWLSARLYAGLSELRHANGNPVCKIYKDPTSTYGESRTQGATVVFNICRSDGSWIPSSTVGRVAAEHDILIRTGGLCNPAGMSQAIGIADEDLQEAYMRGFRCGTEEHALGNRDLPNGMVRASLGAISTTKDVDIFLDFLRKRFVEAEEQPEKVVVEVEKRDAQELAGVKAHETIHHSDNSMEIRTHDSEESGPHSSTVAQSQLRNQKRLRWIPRSIVELRMRSKQRTGRRVVPGSQRNS
ncbi:PLP-dependent transferase [Westerdykella ornata]|uniref:PLP-dependent transferase n=1 Tax=Westerdykella ornata TaxID=318751 RepID=A0A6A6JMM5_WESOR|nr:PLP-dependent transferase [Westerdykella ornata]KAF2277373.1 PLP-dependent transferase [Westerdykella ornata]